MMQVISLTEELLATAKKHEKSESNIETNPPSFTQHNWDSKVIGFCLSILAESEIYNFLGFSLSVPS